MNSMQALWWSALPILLLPLWWHLRQRQRLRSDTLATARFLPAAEPQQQRVPRWRDRLLLLVRLALLLALIAWLAVVSVPWRGDTVFVDPALETEPWTGIQIEAAGMGKADRVALPAGGLSWLAGNEHAWRRKARLLVLAQSLPMDATPPRLAHATEIRLAPAVLAPAASAAAPRQHQIVLAAGKERLAAWRALLAAFAVAGDGRDQYLIVDAPTADTELVIWDRPEAPTAAWQAPLWWRTVPAAAVSTSVNGLALHMEDTAQGRSWSSARWPLQDADGARALYQTWQQLTMPLAPYPLPPQSQVQWRSGVMAAVDGEPAPWLAWTLLALFILEGLLSHARRR
jgi:hypothetical protein